MSIAVLAPGMLSTVQDGGRVGHAALGVGLGGAMDPVALRLANILVGNVDNAAALEITLRGPRLRFEADALIALTGAEIEATCRDTAVPMWRPLALRAGSELSLGGMRRGARTYLAVSGGLATPCVLGSRSIDVNAGIGSALVAGDTLPCSPAPRTLMAPLWRALEHDTAAMCASKWALDTAPWFDLSPAPLGALRGAHFDALESTAQRALFEATFRISADSNRVGYRLEGASLALRQPLELVSSGIVPGTLQLPPGGAPIALMAEAPTTGGYPRIAQIAAIDLPRLAQRRPGDTLRFAQISLDEAQTRYLARERALCALARTVAERLHD